MAESQEHFEQRKRDHLEIALDPFAQSGVSSGLERVQLIHEALPELDWQDLDLSTSFRDLTFSSPFFISSMTAGHADGVAINQSLARLAQAKGLLMGVGSQRRELTDPAAAQEMRELRANAPNAILFGNLGLSQLIRASTDQVRRLIDGLQAQGLFIHTNPLQECLQPEGTPQFRGGLEALEKTARALEIPIVLKEVGCGFSRATLERLKNSGLAAVDISGVGGTHWGRVEEKRLPITDVRAQGAATFRDWGLRTTESLVNARAAGVEFPVWASGGVRDGHDVAKLVAMGAGLVGLAKPWLEAAIAPQADRELERLFDRLQFELKTSLFCTGSRSPRDLQNSSRWQWRNP